MKDEADGALGVEADEHHALPAEAVWQGPEEEAAQAHAAEVDGGGERSQVVPVADQVPLKLFRKSVSKFSTAVFMSLIRVVIKSVVYEDHRIGLK